MFSRTNIPFLAGAIASLTLLTSGIFAVAPYVAFLSSVAALNVAPPIIFILFTLSAVVIALSCKMIKQNKKSQENSKAEVKKSDKELREEKNMLVPIKEELKAKENREKFSGLEKKVDRISEENNNFVTKDEMEEIKKEVNSIKTILRPDTTKNEVEAKLNMKFYAKGEERKWKTTLNDLILIESIKEKLEEICKSKSGGYLFYGPPGTGKTSIGRAIANQTKSRSAFIFIEAASLSKIEYIDQLFEKAEKNSPCLILIDEIDGIGLSRENGLNKNAGSLTSLLTKLDREFLSSKNITVVATTNYKNHLDSALIRGGRLECIEIPGLNKDDTRQKILQERLEKLKDKDSDMKILVQASKGLPMANLICLIDKINETTEKEGEIKYLRTFCKKFKEELNIKDKQNKQLSNRKIKNEGSSGSSSVSSSLGDVSSLTANGSSSILSHVFS